MERTFIMVKPDGVKRKLIGEVIKRIEQVGLNIVAIKMIWPKKDFVERFYPTSDEWFRSVGERAKKAFLEQGLDVKKAYGTEEPIGMGKVVKKWIIGAITSGPVVGMVIEGNNAISIMRKLCGDTYPNRSLPGTIRGDFSVDSVEVANKENRTTLNIVHASGNEKEAKNEINLWFKDEEIINYSE